MRPIAVYVVLLYCWSVGSKAYCWAKKWFNKNRDHSHYCRSWWICSYCHPVVVSYTKAPKAQDRYRWSAAWQGYIDTSI